jgi:hypothetical protein
MNFNVVRDTKKEGRGVNSPIIPKKMTGWGYRTPVGPGGVGTVPWERGDADVVVLRSEGNVEFRGEGAEEVVYHARKVLCKIQTENA